MMIKLNIVIFHSMHLPSAVLHCLQGERLLLQSCADTFLFDIEQSSSVYQSMLGINISTFHIMLGPTTDHLPVPIVPGLCTRALPIIVQDKGEDSTQARLLRRRMDAEAAVTTEQWRRSTGNGMMNNIEQL